MSEFTGVRGTVWFRALTGQASPMPGDPKSVLTSDAPLGNDQARSYALFRIRMHASPVPGTGK